MLMEEPGTSGGEAAGLAYRREGQVSSCHFLLQGPPEGEKELTLYTQSDCTGSVPLSRHPQGGLGRPC